MMTRSDSVLPRIRYLRVVPIAVDREHTGVRSISIQRSATNPSAWQATVMVKNYGAHRADVGLHVRSGTLSRTRVLQLDGGEQGSAEFNFPIGAAGRFVADLDAGFDLEGDHHVDIDFPPVTRARVALITTRPDKLRPLFPRNDQTDVRFLAPGQYNSGAAADLTVFDQTTGAVPASGAAIWIDPPPDRSPWPVKAVIDKARIAVWHSETPVAAGLRTTPAQLGSASVFQTFEGDTVVASAAAGPVVIVRAAGQNRGKQAVIGFDPFQGQARFELTIPLLFANLLSWSLPDIIAPREFNAERVGTVTVPLEAGERADRIRVLDDRNVPVPFLSTRKCIELFVSRPRILQVIAESRHRTISVVLPDVAPFAWTPPASAAIGLPSLFRQTPGAVDLWPLLAVLGALGLLLEWMLFGRRLRFQAQLRDSASHPAGTSRERELVAR
jgi:hypothetical protein